MSFSSKKDITYNEGIIDANTSATIFIGIISIFAIFYAPIVALQVQEKKEAFNEKNLRKSEIFRTLMLTRADGLSTEHVKALNMILLDFYGNQRILDSWKSYFDHLSHVPGSDNNDNWIIWIEKKEELLADLLYDMAIDVGYDFDKVNLKRFIYYPKAFGDSQQQSALIRNGLLDILSGKKAIKIEVQEANKIKP